MDEHIAVLKAAKKVIFSGREARKLKEQQAKRVPENNVDGFIHFSQQKYTSLQEHLSGDTDEIGQFLEANTTELQNFKADPERGGEMSDNSDDEHSPIQIERSVVPGGVQIFYHAGIVSK